MVEGEQIYGDGVNLAARQPLPSKALSMYAAHGGLSSYGYPSRTNHGLVEDNPVEVYREGKGANMWDASAVGLVRRALILATLLLAFASPRPVWAQANLEIPANGSVQSGIGMVSGWKCTAGTLTFTIDNGPAAPLVYGVNRNDTQGVCGDSNNGFIAQWNWNLVGDGPHTLRAFDDGVQFASATFTVTTLGTEVLSGARGEYILPFFADFNTDVVVLWQESAQNFVIVKHAQVADPTVHCAGVEAYENSLNGGQRVIFSFDVADLTKVPGPCGGSFNDCISSFFIPANCSVTVYQDANYFGQSMTFTSPVGDLTTVLGPCGGSFNDCISSLTITTVLPH